MYLFCLPILKIFGCFPLKPFKKKRRKIKKSTSNNAISTFYVFLLFFFFLTLLVSVFYMRTSDQGMVNVWQSLVILYFVNPYKNIISCFGTLQYIWEIFILTSRDINNAGFFLMRSRSNICGLEEAHEGTWKRDDSIGNPYCRCSTRRWNFRRNLQRHVAICNDLLMEHFLFKKLAISSMSNYF